MASPARFLQSGSETSQPIQTSNKTSALDSDFVVLLTALLCALICLAGLALMARCAWLRRSFPSFGRSPPPNSGEGLNKKALQKLPRTPFDTSEFPRERLTECPICLAEFVEADEIRILPECGHGFHVGCVDMWLGSHSSCPSCRRILIAAPPNRCEILSTGLVLGGDSFSEAGSKAREDADANRSLP